VETLGGANTACVFVCGAGVSRANASHPFRPASHSPLSSVRRFFFFFFFGPCSALPFSALRAHACMHACMFCRSRALRCAAFAADCFTLCCAVLCCGWWWAGVYLGKHQRVFPKADGDESAVTKDDHCFSIIAQDKQLHLEAPSADVRDAWAFGFICLLKPLKKKLLGWGSAVSGAYDALPSAAPSQTQAAPRQPRVGSQQSAPAQAPQRVEQEDKQKGMDARV
jgi:hypothetical protein